jgi:dihydrofolate reductase
MRDLVVLSFATLDSVMQAPGGPEEDPAGGFEHGGWAVGYWDDDLSAAMGESMAPPFDLVLGRKTYEIFAAHWPHTERSRRRGAQQRDQARRLDDADRTRMAELEADRATSPTPFASSSSRTAPSFRSTAART